MTYCNAVWGNTSNSYIQPIIVLQKKCIRIIDSAPPLSSTIGKFEKFKILRFPELHVYLVSILMFKFLNDKTLSMYQRFTPVSHQIETRYVRNDCLIYPLMRTNMDQRLLVYHGVKIWNNIPPEVKHSYNIVAFKKHITPYLKQLTTDTSNNHS